MFVWLHEDYVIMREVLHQGRLLINKKSINIMSKNPAQKLLFICH